VALLDENSALGGHSRYSQPQHRETRDELVAAVLGPRGAAEDTPFLNITVLLNTVAVGAFEENWLAAVSSPPEGDRAGALLYKIRAGAVVYATGAYEQPLVFGNSDRPGIMLGSAVQRLLRLYGVAPGRRAVVVTANDDGWAVAADLLVAGVDVAAVADARPEPRTGGRGPMAHNRPMATYWEHTALSAGGRRRVDAVTLAPLDASGHVDAARARTVACDLVVVSVGWSPANGLLAQASAPLVFDNRRMEFLPDRQPAGGEPGRVFAAGRVAGAHDLEGELTDGRLAGQRAAAAAGFGLPPDAMALSAQELARVAELSRTSAHVLSPGSGKCIVCLCEDVTGKDLETAVAEGYNSIELLKRYSTISMGPCQGKMCSQNTLHLCALANGWTVEQTGTTTARPPVTPVSLGALAGRPMEPVQVTPVHEWHRANGAKLMIAGLWLRPEHYGDPLTEVRAVRQRVGLIDVSTLGKFRLTGPGVPALLDRLYINRWNNLAVGRARYGVMCNDEGVILDDGVTARVGEREWYMTTTSSGSGAIFEWLQWWLQSGWGEGIRAVNLSEVNAAFNLAGPRSREVMRRLTDADLSNEAFPYMRVRDALVAGVPCRLLRIGFTGELSYEIHCPAGYGQHVWDAVLVAGRDFGIQPFGVEAQRVLRLEKGHLIVGQDTDGLTDPVAADMELTVKLDKPDFLGQRAIGRVKRDGAKQRLVGFRMATPGATPDEGLQIVRTGADGRPEIIGWITSCRFSPTLDETIGLCWLDAELAGRPGQLFTIRMDGRLEQARVHHGPFYDPQGQRLKE
jgi:sarcosine oxidase subunit alpha